MNPESAFYFCNNHFILSPLLLDFLINLIAVNVFMLISSSKLYWYYFLFIGDVIFCLWHHILCLSKKTQDYDSVTQQFRLSQQKYESQIASLSQEIGQCENEARQYKLKCDSLIRERDESTQLQQAQDRMAAQNKGETEVRWFPRCAEKLVISTFVVLLLHALSTIFWKLKT